MDTRYIYCQDANFNVVALTDEDGVIVEKTWYEAYGTPTCRRISDSDEQTDSHEENPFLFQGRRWTTEANLYYFRNRDYSCTLGRFTQQDPIGYADGMSLYEFVGSSPNDTLDPLGQAKAGPLCCCIKVEMTFSPQGAKGGPAGTGYHAKGDRADLFRVGFETTIKVTVDLKVAPGTRGEKMKIVADNCTYMLNERGSVTLDPKGWWNTKDAKLSPKPYKAAKGKASYFPTTYGKGPSPDNPGYQRYILEGTDRAGGKNLKWKSEGKVTFAITGYQFTCSDTTGKTIANGKPRPISMKLKYRKSAKGRPPNVTEVLK